MSKDKDLELLATFVKIALFCGGEGEVIVPLADETLTFQYNGEVKRICDKYCRKPVKK